MKPTDQTSTEQDLVVKTFLKAWTAQVSKINEFIESVSEEGLKKEIAPEKNTGIYILGHLVAVHDALLPLLGFGQKLYPHLEQIFITSPDKAGLEYPSFTELKNAWNEVNEKLIEHFSQLDFDAWLTKHEAVSEEAFAREPHRNKLNVLISRTTHMSYHHGQLILLKEKKKK